MGVPRGVPEVKGVRGHSWGPTVVRVGVPREGSAKGHERVLGVKVGVTEWSGWEYYGVSGGQEGQRTGRVPTSQGGSPKVAQIGIPRGSQWSEGSRSGCGGGPRESERSERGPRGQRWGHRVARVGVPRRVPGIRWGRRSRLGSQSCHSGGPRGSQMLEGSQSGWGGGPNWGPRGQGGGTGGVLEVWEGSQVSEWGSQRVSRGWKDPEVTVGVPWGSGWGLWGVPGVKEGPWGGGSGVGGVQRGWGGRAQGLGWGSQRDSSGVGGGSGGFGIRQRAMGAGGSHLLLVQHLLLQLLHQLALLVDLIVLGGGTGRGVGGGPASPGRSGGGAGPGDPPPYRPAACTAYGSPPRICAAPPRRCG